MRIEKSPNVEPTIKIGPGIPSPKTTPQQVSADRPAVGARSGDVAEITQELQEQSSLDRLNRQALLQAVKQRLVEGEYNSRKASEKTASAILRFLETRIPR